MDSTQSTGNSNNSSTPTANHNASTTTTTTTTTKRSERLRDTLYADMMKPDEDLSKLADPAERRRIQNRLAQRAYRRKMREQKNEVEKLREEIKKLQESPECSSNTSSGSRQTTPCTPTHSITTPIISTASVTPCTFEAINTPPSDQQWMSGYFHEWPVASTSPESFLTATGLITPTELEGPPSYDETTRRCYSPEDFGATAIAKSPGRQRRKTRRGSSQMRRLRSTLPRSAGSPRPTPQSPHSPWLASPPPPMDVHLPAPMDAHLPVMMMGAEPQMPLYPPHFDLHSQPEEFQYPSPPPMTEASQWQMPMDGGLVRTPSESSSLSNRTAPRCLPDAKAPILHLAVAGGHTDTLRTLLNQRNVSLNVRDSAGYTPLQRAIINGHTEIVELLLSHGADVEG